jgi:hypothetical protein
MKAYTRARYVVPREAQKELKRLFAIEREIESILCEDQLDDRDRGRLEGDFNQVQRAHLELLDRCQISTNATTPEELEGLREALERSDSTDAKARKAQARQTARDNRDPRKIAELLLVALLKPSHADGVTGDLNERFHGRMREIGTPPRGPAILGVHIEIVVAAARAGNY